MAAVSQTTNPTRHVIGDLTARTFTISGASGSTLDTGMRQVQIVIVQQSTAAGTVSLITSFSVVQSSGGSAVITFNTGGGAMVTEVVMVIARVG